MQSHRTVAQPFAAPFPPPTVDPAPDAMQEPARQSLADSTLVQTTKGLATLGSLGAGQRLLTRSGTFEHVTAIGRTHLTRRQLQDNPELAPIRFDPGALPGMLEDVATLVSPDCPVAWSASPRGGGRYPARAFCDGGLIRSVIPDDGITYVRVHFATAQEIRAGGIWVHLAPEDQKIIPMACPVPRPDNEIRMFRPLRA